MDGFTRRMLAVNSILFHIRVTNWYFNKYQTILYQNFLITWCIIRHLDQIKVELNKSMNKTILEKQTIPRIV